MMNTERKAVTDSRTVASVEKVRIDTIAATKEFIRFLRSNNSLPAGLWIRTMKDAQATLKGL